MSIIPALNEMKFNEMSYFTEVIKSQPVEARIIV